MQIIGSINLLPTTHMSYILACIKNGVPYAVSPDKNSNSFQLIPIESDVSLTKAYSHPYKSGAMGILKWIQENDPNLSEGLSVQDDGRFRR